MRVCIFVATSVLLMGWASFAAVSPAQRPASPQEPQRDSTQPASKRELAPEEIIAAFSAKETEFYEAWIQYTYRQDATVRVLSVNGNPKHESLRLISDVVFLDNGKREVQQVRETGMLNSVVFTKEDEDVIDNLQPFSLTQKELPLYDLQYLGKERVDELDCYVFSVKPKSTRGGRMYFQGKIWVDDQDLQIVRTMGNPVPERRDQHFPEFETLRQFIDGKYWFPVWTHADSVLSFATDRIRVEETITYDSYRHFGAQTSVQFGTKKH